MPEHVLMSEIEIITDGGRRRHWTAADKLFLELLRKAHSRGLRRL